MQVCRFVPHGEEQSFLIEIDLLHGFLRLEFSQVNTTTVRHNRAHQPTLMSACVRRAWASRSFQQTVYVNFLRRFAGRPDNRRRSHAFTLHRDRTAMVFSVSEKSLMSETAKSFGYTLLHFTKLDRTLFGHSLAQCLNSRQMKFIFVRWLCLF